MVAFVLDQYIRACAEEAFGIHLDPEIPGLELCCRRLTAAMAFHRAGFTEAKKFLSDDGQLLGHLRQGEFGIGSRPGYDLVVDILLAALLEANVHGAAEAFEKRFGPQLERWARQMDSRDGQIVDTFLPDLLLPRKKSGPRIATYKGEGPMDGWLKRVFRSQIIRDNEEAGLVLAPPDTTKGYCIVDPSDEYAQKECTQKLTPAFTKMFAGLEDVHQTVLQMAVVDGVEQKKIAAFLGVRDYKVTRLKQEAIEKVARAFHQIAAEEGNMSESAVQECLRLIMDRFGESGVSELIKIHKTKENN
ncbi:MAG: hypothetical protein WC975_15100 [Phycisphaerae bacterium]